MIVGLRMWCVSMGGKSISRSATSSPDLFDEIRTDGKGSWELYMSVGISFWFHMVSVVFRDVVEIRERFTGPRI